MMFSVKAFTMAAATVGAVAMLVTGIVAMLAPSWGQPLMELLGVIAPGVKGADFGSVVLITLYAAVDGVWLGMLFAWVYNRFAAPAAPPPSVA